MKKVKLTSRQFSGGIRSLAREALSSLLKGSPAYKEAVLRVKKPIDYLRCVEFPLTYAQLSIEPGMKVLDIASPQWFSLFLARQFPDTEFYYVNILEDELEQVRAVAQGLELANIRYLKEDARSLSFRNGVFDRAVSISAIEHIDPDVGGDAMAFREIHRVLVEDGKFTVSLPLKSEPSLVYDSEHPVWEREKQERNFYMRNYDLKQFEELAGNTGFRIAEASLMFERPGLFAMEYWEGGPGRQKKSKNFVIKLKKKIDKLIGLRLEGFLASRYIQAGSAGSPRDRVINIVSTLEKNSV